MRDSRLRVVINLVLLTGPLFTTSGQTVLDSRLELGEEIQNRLAIHIPDSPIVRDARLFLWLSLKDEALPSDAWFQAGVTTSGLALGPLTLTGGLRELSTPHVASARGTAWTQATGSTLDSGMEPVRRWGVSVTPDFVRAHALAVKSDEGVAAALTAGSLRAESDDPHRPHAEVICAASRAAIVESVDLADIPWFEREPTRPDMLHLILRSRFQAGSENPDIEIGPAAGVSLARSLRPGWWTRLAFRTESSGVIATRPQGSASSDEHLWVVEGSGALSLSSVSYRLPFAQLPDHAGSAALSYHFDRDGQAGVTVDGRVRTEWLPAATLPGVAFTLRGLQLDDAQIDLGVYAEAGLWRFTLSSETEIDWGDGFAHGAETGGADGGRLLSASPEMSLGARYEAIPSPPPDHAVRAASGAGERPRMPGLPLDAELMLRVFSKDPVAIRGAVSADSAGNEVVAGSPIVVGTGGVQVGPTISGSTRLIELTASVWVPREEDSWRIKKGEAACRVSFKSGPAICRGEVQLNWVPEANSPVTWAASLGWTVRSFTGEE